MEPITLGLLMLALGLGAGGAGGYAFGSAAKEEKFKALQQQIAKQAKIIEDQEKRINNLLLQINEIKTSRNTLQKFMWFVFQSDPKLYAKFGELEREELERRKAKEELKKTVTVLQQQFPDHPAIKVV